MLFLLLILFSVTRAQNFISVISESYSYVSYPDYRILNDGNIIPTVALGTFTPYQSVRYSGAIEQAVITAIEAGYRHIDTAPLYYDEGEIGNAINNVTSRGIVTREELFITTKLDLRVNDTAGVIPSLLSSLERLQLYYVDLFLIHFSEALGTGQEYDILALWRGMEEAQKIGLTVSIGVSNFNSSHINKILTYGTIRPAVNQIEVNPTYTELELTAYCLREGIAVMSYAPYGFMVPRPFRNITAPPPTFDDQTLRIIANKYGKTTKQVVLRYLIDRGTIPIPQSVYKDEIEENIDIFDFRLTREEVYLINEFNKNVKVYSNDDLSSADFLFNYAYGCDTATISKVNPTFANLELVAYCQQENITVVACGSHGFTVPRPFRSVSPSPPPQFNNTLLVEIAKKYSKTTNQVILRYLIDRKVIPLVKSTNITHIKENFDLFDFKLTKDEVYEINNFNENIKVYDYTFSEAEGLPKYFY